MAVVNLPNGDTGLDFRTKLNSNFTDLDTRMSAEEIKFAYASLSLIPQVTPPAYLEGQMYYDSNDGITRIQGPFSDVEVAVGHGMHIHVRNETGVAIAKGMAVTQIGVTVTGEILIKLASADTFDNARLLGVTSASIANNTNGAATTFGEITSFDTSALPTGVPLYLSSTVAGTFTATAPDIITRIGGVTISDASLGKLFVFIINNKNLPQVVGGMQGQNTPLYPVVTTAQDILDYTTEESVVVSTSLLNGTITVPNAGNYRMHFTASITFPSATATRSVTFEFYDQTNTAILFSYVKNIPRDATEDGLGFSFPISSAISDIYKIRIKSSTAIAVTFTDISFDIESVTLR